MAADALRANSVIDHNSDGDPIVVCPNCSQPVAIELTGVAYHTIDSTDLPCPMIGKSLRLVG